LRLSKQLFKGWKEILIGAQRNKKRIIQACTHQIVVSAAAQVDFIFLVTALYLHKVALALRENFRRIFSLTLHASINLF
tara:strand:- start:2257 stop:2493 length:237 start_codon:yes stop_codon:yes gene_type:complete